MDEWIMGIDVGTSSLKVLCINRLGTIVKVSENYGMESRETGKPTTPDIWWNALKRAVHLLSKRLNARHIKAISLSAQTGTYILFQHGKNEDAFTAIGWGDRAGESQLQWLKENFDEDYFIEHISMGHPLLISYPMPRIFFFQTEMKEQWEKMDKLLQAKDFLYYQLTGIFASDPYTWRGLANLGDGTFHDVLLKDIGMEKSKLPELFNPWECPGFLHPELAQEWGMEKDIPVFLGCNDFFASLLGMGIYDTGDCFDITGTSEHIGFIDRKMRRLPELVYGPYFNQYIQYGGTASSGSSMAWAFQNFGQEFMNSVSLDQVLNNTETAPPPIFLPYIQGERAPIWDVRARGVYFGLESTNKSEDLVYAVQEGVVFSLYHIWKRLQPVEGAQIRIAGGASSNEGMNRMKASLFNIPFAVMEEKEGAALGAAIFGGIGCGWFDSMQDGIRNWVRIHHVVEPERKYMEILMKRFEIYEGLYPALKGSFHKWSQYKEGMRHGISCDLWCR